ncbi:unnamed protein product [Ceratitis capitata]|uniref:(Mediterranean fruit fly) hypothetical protein n=1 Tax=Ceratitis capitata TaxID=7213 RepID=A0A811USV0_CERCA|nr:unnamed protein product [Ceratitis capitata]
MFNTHLGKNQRNSRAHPPVRRAQPTAELSSTFYANICLNLFENKQKKSGRNKFKFNWKDMMVTMTPILGVLLMVSSSATLTTSISEGIRRRSTRKLLACGGDNWVDDDDAVLKISLNYNSTD